MQEDININIKHAENFIKKFEEKFIDIEGSSLSGMNIKLRKSTDDGPSMVFFSYSTKQNKHNYATPISCTQYHKDFVQAMNDGFYTYQDIAVKSNQCKADLHGNS